MADFAVADRWSAESFEAVGWHADVRAARARLLIHLGRPLESLALLESTRTRHLDRRARARLACARSIGHARMAQLDEALIYRERAKKLDPTSRELSDCDEAIVRARAQAQEPPCARATG
jgi:hypothetical protein